MVKPVVAVTLAMAQGSIVQQPRNTLMVSYHMFTMVNISYCNIRILLSFLKLHIQKIYRLFVISGFTPGSSSSNSGFNSSQQVLNCQL